MGIYRNKVLRRWERVCATLTQMEGLRDSSSPGTGHGTVRAPVREVGGSGDRRRKMAFSHVLHFLHEIRSKVTS